MGTLIAAVHLEIRGLVPLDILVQREDAVEVHGTVA